MVKYFVRVIFYSYFCAAKTSRSRAVVARRAHNPEVVGSSPASATKKQIRNIPNLFLCILPLVLSLVEVETALIS